MNITISINKDFGELTDKKIERLASNLPKIASTQNIDSQIALFHFESHTIILNRPSEAVAVSFSDINNLKLSFEDFKKLLELLDLDMVGRSNIAIEDIENLGYSVAESSLNILGLKDETDGVGFRFLVDTFTENPKEFRIEPRIDDFNKIYISSSQSQNEVSELTIDFVKESLDFLLAKINVYKKLYLEKGGKSGQ